MVFILPELTRKTIASDKPTKLYRNPVFLAEERRNRMQEHKLSQVELACELGVSRARVTQILNVLKLKEDVREQVRSLGDPMPSRLMTERRLRSAC